MADGTWKNIRIILLVYFATLDVDELNYFSRHKNMIIYLSRVSQMQVRLLRTD